MELIRGSLVGMLESDLKIRRYDIRWGDSIARVRQGLFFLKQIDKDLVVGARKGELTVHYQGQRQSVASGNGVAVRPDSPKPEPVPIGMFTPLTDTGEKSLVAAAPVLPPAIHGAVESVAEPTLSLGDTLWKLPTLANDQRAIGLSITGMQAICTLLLTADSGEGLPESIDLKTLKELGMEDKERKSILKLFQDEQLLSYRRLPGGGYEIYARSLDSDHSLLRGSNGKVEVLSNDETL
jgi:hypothetical protein